MSDYLSYYPPSNSFDKNYKTFAHSYGGSYPDGYVIKVTLNPRQVYKIVFIRVVNRYDCCRERLLGFMVFISSLNGGMTNSGAITEVKSDYGFSIVEIGNKVELRNSKSIDTAVNFAEILVYGTPYLGNATFTLVYPMTMLELVTIVGALL